MARAKQLECRITIAWLPDGRIRLGMYDPYNGRHEPLGTHGPDRRQVDAAIRGLKERIEREGHRLTFAESSESR